MNTPRAHDTPIAGLSPDAFSSLFQAIGGLRNRRALLAMLGCLFAGMLVAGLLTLLSGRGGGVLAFLGFLVFFVASATGVNAAGVLLMDQARGVPLRPLTDAIVCGLMCIPKFIALWLLLMLATLAVFVVLALIFVVCKIPFLGPLMFAVVFPLSVVIAGVTLCGVSLCLFLALPAIWEGAGIMRAIAQALAIARSRLVESLLLMAVVAVLSMIVGFIVFSVLVAGFMPTMAMSASIVGGGLGGLQGLMGMAQGYGGMSGGPDGGGASYAIAGAFGSALLWALAASLVSLVYLLGLNLVYLRVSEGLDVSETEAAMKSGLADARRRATELSHKAKEAAERAREQASAMAAKASAPPAAAEPAPPAFTPAPFAPAPPVSAAPPPFSPAPPPFSPAPPPFSPAPPPFSPAPPPYAAPPVFTPAPMGPPPPPVNAPPPAAPVFRPAPPAAEPPVTAPSPAVTMACPHCLSPVTGDDMFCGVCGYKLK